jgi:hypothetical protein
MWMWLSTIAVLIGAEFDTVIACRAEPPPIQPMSQ